MSRTWGTRQGFLVKNICEIINNIYNSRNKNQKKPNNKYRDLENEWQGKDESEGTMRGRW